MNGLRVLRDVYNKSYDRRPLTTLCITNGILGAISDGLAQTISYYEHQRKYSHRIEDRYLPENLKAHEDQWPEPPRLDGLRMARFALYNFCVAPIVGRWYIFLDRQFPGAVVKRVVIDQVAFAPLSLAAFFTTMGYAETRHWQGVQEKFRDAYTPALIANYKVWPLVQLVNFKIMPIQYRLPFVSSLGILWNAYLSWINNASRQEEQIIERMHQYALYRQRNEMK